MLLFLFGGTVYTWLPCQHPKTFDASVDDHLDFSEALHVDLPDLTVLFSNISLHQLIPRLSKYMINFLWTKKGRQKKQVTKKKTNN